MNKNLLFGIAMILGGAALAQNSTSIPTSVTPLKVNPKLAKLALPYHKNEQLGANSFESMAYNSQQNVHENEAKVFSGLRIGTTQYQLQTNASICNRMVLSSDGTIGATWTMSQQNNTTWTDRGTGYNYFDGTSWTFGSAAYGTTTTVGPTTAVEAVRTGFTNLGLTSTGEEVIVCHETAVAAIHLDSRPAKGTGTWTSAAVTGLSDTWARVAVGGANGKTLHVISSSGLGGGASMITFHGQTGSVNYSRSQDGGTTWDIVRYIIPAIDSSHYLGFGGDSYAIDSRGDTVAIVVGGFDVDVVLLKSVDNGTSWTKTIVKKFPIPMYTSATMYTDTLNPLAATEIDTLETNDASLEVMLDNQGKAHVWYGKMQVSCSTPGTATGQGLSYFPATQGLMYWNENMGNAKPVMITSVLDLNYSGHPADGILNVDYDNTTAGLLGFGTYQVSLTSFPSAGIDASGKIYLSYSGLFEGVNDQGTAVPGAGSATPGKSFRHTYLMRSDDGGTTWCGPTDITDPDIASGNYDYHEGVYGAMPKHLDGSFVHVIVQDDNSVGHGVASSGTTVDPQGGPADILYYKVPSSDIVCVTGVNDITKTNVSVNLFPNPASNSVSLKFNTTKVAKVNIKIYNGIGQEVSYFDNQTIVNGTILKINLANYKAGIYFVNTVIDGKTFSQKLIIE